MTTFDPNPSAEDMSPLPQPRANPVLAALHEGVRLALFRPVRPHASTPTLKVLVALILVHLVLSFLFQVARVGPVGQFELYELPRALFLLPLVLFCGLACAEAGKDADLALRVAVAISALAVALIVPMGLVSLGVQRGWFPAEAQRYGVELWYTFLFWWAAASAFTIAGLVRAPRFARLRALAYGLFLLVAPAYWMPAGQLWSPVYDEAQSADPSRGLIAESVFYAQQDLLADSIDALASERPGVEDVYVLTAALFAAEDVFMKEVGVITELLEKRFDAASRSLKLVNNRRTLTELPIASITSVRRALAAIGERMNPEEDLLVLYLTSHGSEQHRLSVDLWPLKLEPIDPSALRAALDEAGIRWRVVIVSACYSGGYVEPLKDERTLIITAANATRQSFGCGATSDFTYLAKALFDEELRNTYSFEAAFEQAKKSIEQRERAKGFTPSEPQLYVGAKIRQKLSSVERRLAGVRPHLGSDPN